MRHRKHCYRRPVCLPSLTGPIYNWLISRPFHATERMQEEIASAISLPFQVTISLRFKNLADKTPILSRTIVDPPPRLTDGHANSSSARRHPSLPQEGHSAFDDALTEGTTAFGSSGHVRQGTTGSGSRRIGSPGMKPSGRSPRARDVAPAGPAGSAHERHGSASSRGTSPPASADGRKPANFTGTITTSSASADMSDKMRPAVSTDDVAVSSSRRAQSRPVFSLAHERWVRCGFTAGFAGGKGGPEECIGRALRGASNVLALDSINYFLARCGNMPLKLSVHL